MVDERPFRCPDLRGGPKSTGLRASVVLPVLDERDALPWVLGRMPAGLEPVVVDNGSTDGSGELARSLGVRVVAEPVRGFGAACFAGLRAARHELVGFMDCDGSLDPRDLPGLFALVDGGHADLAMGLRQADPGAWPVHARAANRLLAWELRRRFGWAVTDLGPDAGRPPPTAAEPGHRRPPLGVAVGDAAAGR